MLYGRPVAVLGGVRIPFCRQNTAYADVGNLGLSVRTLQRKLRQENQSFQALLDQVRRTLASDWLSHGNLAVVEIGYRARNTTTSSRTGTIWYGGSGSDLTVGGAAAGGVSRCDVRLQ